MLWEFVKKILGIVNKGVETSGPPSRISSSGLDIIKAHEGLRLEAYLPTKNDVWTIGYGHTKTAK